MGKSFAGLNLMVAALKDSGKVLTLTLTLTLTLALPLPLPLTLTSAMTKSSALHQSSARQPSPKYAPRLRPPSRLCAR